MKRIISCLLFVTLVLASVLAIIPASAAATKTNVMGNSNADKQWANEGNVFYFDYHKYIADGKTFPMAASDKGRDTYQLRLGVNAGSGTASVCDGVKNSGSFTHSFDSSGININGKSYNHGFGYSFKEAVMVDSVTLYLPEGTNISAIDVYGASSDVSNQVYGKEAPKTLLASFTNVNTTATTPIESTNVIVVTSGLKEAFALEYIFFAVTTTSSSAYKFYEIEATGILASEAADFTALRAEYARYSTLVESDYTTESWSDLVTALAAADLVNKNCLSTEGEITTATTTLKNAIDALVVNPADKTALAEEISSAAALVETNYTPATWAALQTALTAANAANTAPNITQSAVNKAKADLTAAIAALQAPADKTAIETELAKTTNLVEADYTTASWSALQAAITAATAVKNDLNATTQQVATAAANLKSAIENLAKPADKTELSKTITAAKALNQADYNVTPGAWAALQTSIQNAEAVVANVNATQSDVDSALTSIKQKVDALKLKTPADDNNETDAPETDAPETDATDAPATDAPATDAPATNAPATDAPASKGGCGSAVATTAIIVGLVTTLGTALVVKKRD